MSIYPDTKFCNKCRTILLLCDFHKDKTRKDGRYCYCKSCVKSLQKSQFLDEKYKKTRNEYSHSDKSRIRNKKYNNSAKAKACKERYLSGFSTEELKEKRRITTN